MAERGFFLPLRDDPRARLAVRSELEGIDAGLVDIADEDVTSPSPMAQRLDTPANAVRRLCLTRQEAAWLRDVLVALELGAPEAPAMPEHVKDGESCVFWCPGCKANGAAPLAGGA